MEKYETEFWTWQKNAALCNDISDKMIARQAALAIELGHPPSSAELLADGQWSALKVQHDAEAVTSNQKMKTFRITMKDAVVPTGV